MGEIKKLVGGAEMLVGTTKGVASLQIQNFLSCYVKLF